MNLKNLMMWGVIVLLVVGLFQLFQNPKSSMVSDKMPFSEFLKNIDDGRVMQVKIKGNNIEGILSNGTAFSTYAPNDPNLVEKLTSKGVTITAAPLEDKMPSMLGILLSWFPMLLLIGVWVFFMRQMQGGRGGAMGFGKSKAKLLSEARGKITFNDVAGIDEAKEIIFKSFSDILLLISGAYYPPRSTKIINLIDRLKKNKFTKSTLGGCIVQEKDNFILISKELKIRKMSYQLRK